jgi:hypothetical protein
MRRGADLWLFLFSAGSCLAAHPCEPCHAKEIGAYSHSAMANSLRRPGKEPTGSFSINSGARFTILTGTAALTQRMDRDGETSEYRVAYVIGSGSHASGYLVQIGDHLFQSPICYYTNRHAYDLAPGYERIFAPDFTRPVGEQCLLCHAGVPLHIAGTPNRYAAAVFAAEGISCDRCHGPVEEHLRHPVPGSIVNPAKLPPAARDSVCEQCHLAGAARILNPGKAFEDFRAGRPLEETFTIFTAGGGRGFRVISHAEQLAQSMCARASGGRIWCGTCHDPHPAAAPSVATYNARCQTCHAGAVSASHPAAKNCVSCHMARREARDGGHTAFTDHRIAKRPADELPIAPQDELVPWRLPDPALQTRNLALAYVEAGVSNRSPAQIVRGYRMLSEVEKASPNDVAVLRAIGRALLLGKQPAEALRAFERVLALTPGSATSEEDLGVACLEAGRTDDAVAHLEKAIASDPLLLTAATALQQAYRHQGHPDRAEALAKRIRDEMGSPLRDLPIH